MKEIFRPFINYQIDEKMFQILKEWENSDKLGLAPKDQEYLQQVLKDNGISHVLFGNMFHFARQFYREMYWRQIEKENPWQ